MRLLNQPTHPVRLHGAMAGSPTIDAAEQVSGFAINSRCSPHFAEAGDYPRPNQASSRR
jgi:hypothetical protein